MAKQIIALEKNLDQVGFVNIRVAFWLPVASGREVPRPGASSAYRSISTAELDALKAGTIIEEVYLENYPPAMSTTAIKADLLSRYGIRATAILNLPDPNQYYGIFYDGSVWSA